MVLRNKKVSGFPSNMAIPIHVKKSAPCICMVPAAVLQAVRCGRTDEAVSATHKQRNGHNGDASKLSRRIAACLAVTTQLLVDDCI